MKARDRSKTLVKALLDSERNFIFTSDEGFNDQCSDNLPPPPHMTNDKGKKKMFLDLVRERIDLYLTIVVRNLRDSVPKCVAFNLVVKSKSDLNKEIYSVTSSGNNEVLDSLSEPEHLKIERENLRKAIKVLRKAQKKLDKEGLLGRDDEDDDDY